MAEEPIVDMQQLLDNVGGDENLANMLLARMRQDMPQRMAEIRAALANGDCAAAHASTHPLKGGLASIRASEAQSVARLIDDAARDGDLETARSLMSQLEEAIDRLDGFIKEQTNPSLSAGR
ncbi:Hpt domain-containing protein [Halorhodospira halochloris]|uniref:Hpt domain-containing protein n=1 Tax=Halorhodospira halochloris TaxID=1052 RepID=UPI001EE85A59|nr:Hpt domain-containing protein [Halorhodospira halochloris]MCG5529472.1 Hpt domain-containing protein [Halorhodospira halochloris]